MPAQPPNKTPAPAFDAVSFDVDGTLYELGPMLLRLFPALLRHPRLLGNYKKAMRSVRGERHPALRAELARRLAGLAGGSPDKALAVITRVIHEQWPLSFGPETVLEGLPELLADLDRAGIPRVVISDYPAQAKLQQMQLDGWAAVVACEDLGAYKPLPDGMLEAARLLELPPARILHIGDRPDTDEAMAVAAGAPCLIRGRDYQSVAELRALLLPGATDV